MGGKELNPYIVRRMVMFQPDATKVPANPAGEPTAYFVPPKFSGNLNLTCKSGFDSFGDGVKIITPEMNLNGDSLALIGRKENWTRSKTPDGKIQWTNKEGRGTVAENGCLPADLPQMNAGGDTSLELEDDAIPTVKARKIPDTGKGPLDELERKVFGDDPSSKE